MPQLFGRALANVPSYSNWNFSSWVPNHVVVFLGANDYSTPGGPSYGNFSTAYNGLLDAIEEAYVKHNPSLSIIAVCGPFSSFCFNGGGGGPSYVERIVTARGDSRVKFVSLNGTLPNPSYPGPYTGCDGHPNVEGQKLMADALRGGMRMN